MKYHAGKTFRNIFLTLFILVMIISLAWVLAFSWKVKQSSLSNDMQFHKTVPDQPVKSVKPSNQAGPGDETTGEKIPASVGNEKVKVNLPQPGAMVKNPLIIDGEARGNWYFEASFPVVLEDSNGKILGQTIATALGDWMTAEFVPFNAKLDFKTSTTTYGVIVLKKDNPSGLPANDEEARMPIRLK
jgi:hypothetical protein